MTTVLPFPKGRFEPWVNKARWQRTEVEAWVEERFG